MQDKIKSQQGLKTYAELAGIALDRLGLKNQVKNALSGFLGDDEQGEATPAIEHNDQSGIIENQHFSNQQHFNPQPKNDLIDLINSCLETMDKTTLGVVFSIFSEIEKNNALALQILTMINNTSINPQNPITYETDN